MSEIEKLFEATKPFRDELAKLQVEVEGYKDTEATLMAKLFTTEDKLKGAELQNDKVKGVLASYASEDTCDCDGLEHRGEPCRFCRSNLLMHDTNDMCPGCGGALPHWSKKVGLCVVCKPH